MRDRVASAYLDAVKAARAELLLRENLARGAELARRPAWLDSQLQASLARALMAQQRNSEALPLLQGAVRVLERELGPRNRRTIAAAAALAQVL